MTTKTDLKRILNKLSQWGVVVTSAVGSGFM